MKTTKILVVLAPLLILITSCGNAPDEKIIGEWEVQGEGIVVSFKADGSGYDKYHKREFKWELVKEKDLILRIKFNEQDIDESIVSFINRDEIELLDRDYPDDIITIKRIR